MEIGAVFDTVKQRDYHEEYLKEILGPMIGKHKEGLIVLHNGTTLHLLTVRQCEDGKRFIGLRLDKLFKFVSPENFVKVRKTLFPCLRYRLREQYDTGVLGDALVRMEKSERSGQQERIDNKTH